MNQAPPENKARQKSEAEVDTTPGYLVVRLNEGERICVGSTQFVINSVIGRKVVLAIKADRDTKIYRPDRHGTPR